MGFTTSQTYITIENRSGNALAEGLIELVPSGVLAPFRRELPRMEWVVRSCQQHGLRVVQIQRVAGQA